MLIYKLTPPVLALWLLWLLHLLARHQRQLAAERQANANLRRQVAAIRAQAAGLHEQALALRETVLQLQQLQPAPCADCPQLDNAQEQIDRLRAANQQLVLDALGASRHLIKRYDS